MSNGVDVCVALSVSWAENPMNRKFEKVPQRVNWDTNKNETCAFRASDYVVALLLFLQLCAHLVEN